jgi:ribonuclease BN (tRNA processing enzyme)
VPTAGFVLTKDGQSLAYSADTGSTDEFWDALSDAPNLRALVVEVSFPNALQKLADITGHLTSQSLARELKKVRRALNVPIIIFGVKPEYEKDIRKELKDLRLSGLEIPKTDKVYSL